MGGQYPNDKLIIIGIGIVAAMEAYFAYLSAKENGTQIRSTIYEKNADYSGTPTYYIVPSLNPDEILSVVPRGQELVKKLKILFSEPGGIYIDDVEGINDSQVFAGASLILKIEISSDKLKQLKQYEKFNHCMEVHQEGVVLAWQARLKDNKIIIGVAGTKAFYGNQKPTIEQNFAKNRNLLQLNIINDVLSEFVSIALNKNTRGQKLTTDDLNYLVTHGVTERWVGIRAVAYDGFPTLGTIYNAKGITENARCTTHLGSDGASFAPAAVVASRNMINENTGENDLIETVLKYGDSRRAFTY